MEITKELLEKIYKRIEEKIETFPKSIVLKADEHLEKINFEVIPLGLDGNQLLYFVRQANTILFSLTLTLPCDEELLLENVDYICERINILQKADRIRKDFQCFLPKKINGGN